MYAIYFTVLPLNMYLFSNNTANILSFSHQEELSQPQKVTILSLPKNHTIFFIYFKDGFSPNSMPLVHSGSSPLSLFLLHNALFFKMRVSNIASTFIAQIFPICHTNSYKQQSFLSIFFFLHFYF